MSRIIGVLVYTAFVAASWAADVAQKEDPIVGKWRWTDRQVVECRTDQTFTAEPTKRQGTWKRVEASTVENKYTLSWDKGLYTDTLMMSRDGKKLSGKNQDGKRIEATKIE